MFSPCLDSLNQFLDGLGLVSLRLEIGNQPKGAFFSFLDHDWKKYQGRLRRATYNKQNCALVVSQLLIVNACYYKLC